MSLVDVLPVEPVTATTRADERVADLACDRRESRDGIRRDERRRSASRERVRDEVLAAADRDEQIAFLDPPRVDLHAR